MSRPWYIASLAGALAVAPPAADAAPHDADIDGSGAVDVADVTCFIDAALTNAAGAEDPGCQALDDTAADLDCDGALSVTDVTRAILLVLWELAPESDVAALLGLTDFDLDGVHDACDDDDDGDGVTDACELELGSDPFDWSDVGDALLGCTCSKKCTYGGKCVEVGEGKYWNDCQVCEWVDGAPAWIALDGVPCSELGCWFEASCYAGFCCGSWPLVCFSVAPNVLCTAYGEAGEFFDCPLLLARDSESTQVPAAVQLYLQFEPARLRLIGLYDVLILPGPFELEVPTPPSTLYPTGHGVALDPPDPDDWWGERKVTVSNPSNPLVGVTSAHFEFGSLEGDPHFATARFQILDSTAPTTCDTWYAAHVGVYGILGSTPAADPMPGVVYQTWNPGELEGSFGVMVVDD